MPVEYSGEDQAICAVGLAKPRHGVFVPAIQHILILCTTVEVRPLTCALHAARGRHHKITLMSGDSWLQACACACLFSLFTVLSDI